VREGDQEVMERRVDGLEDGCHHHREGAVDEGVVDDDVYLVEAVLEDGWSGHRALHARRHTLVVRLVPHSFCPMLPSGGPRRGVSAPRSASQRCSWSPPPSEEGTTLKLNIIPLSMCSAMWQWAIHSPGLVT
jgi:hypothetical protein